MGLLRKNIFYQSLYQILIIALPLITVPYVARVLGVQNSGIYSYTRTIANYFEVFCMLGLEQYGNRCIARARDNQDELNRVFSELLFLHIIISAIISGLYFIYVFVFGSNYRGIFLLQGFYVVSTLFDINWFFFGIEKFKLTVLRNTVIKLLATIAIFVFVKNENDLWVYTVILSVSVFITQVAIWPMAWKYVTIVRVPIKSIKVHISPLLLLFVAVIAANLNRMIDKVMLGWFDKINDLGCYDYADRIVRVPLGFIAAIGTVMLSKMSNMYSRNNKEDISRILDGSACVVLLVSIGMGFGIVAIAPEFILLFLGKEYQESIVLLVILALSIPLVGWNNYIRTQILIPREMDMIYSRAVMIGAIFNVALNCILIYIIGAIGASIATVASYFVIFILQMIPIIREVKNTSKYVVFPLCAGIVMYIMVRWCSHITDRIFWSVCIELLIGAIVYGGLSVLYLWKRQPRILKVVIKTK